LNFKVIVIAFLLSIIMVANVPNLTNGD